MPWKVDEEGKRYYISQTELEAIVEIEEEKRRKYMGGVMRLDDISEAGKVIIDRIKVINEVYGYGMTISDLARIAQVQRSDLSRLIHGKIKGSERLVNNVGIALNMIEDGKGEDDVQEFFRNRAIEQGLVQTPRKKCGNDKDEAKTTEAEEGIDPKSEECNHECETCKTKCLAGREIVMRRMNKKEVDSRQDEFKDAYDILSVAACLDVEENEVRYAMKICGLSSNMISIGDVKRVRTVIQGIYDLREVVKPINKHSISAN